jgi:molybdate transport system substrate-binding protein
VHPERWLPQKRSEKQISQGAGADLFFSAAEDKFEKLVHDGDIDKKDLS